MLGNVPFSLADTRKKEKPAMNDGRGGESAPTGVFLNTMELSRIEAPVYGQVEVYGIFQELTVTSEEAEFYVVLKGSRLTHVTGAKQSSDGRRLCFTLPGHDLPEMVSLTFYYHEDNKVEPCGSNTSLEYVTDVAQEIADYLTINRDHLVPQSYLEVQKRTCSTRTRGWKKNACHDEEVSSGHSDYEDDVLIRPNPEDEAGLRELDEKITLAVANLDYLQHWRKGESQPHEAENSPRETLLHLAVRLDLLHLSRFLLHQPKGQRVLTLPNQEGDTPLQLAQKSKEHTLFRVLATPVPAAADAVGRCCLWSDRSSVLTYHARNDLLTLTMQHAPEAYSHDVILVFRDKLRERSILKLITALRDCMNKGYDDKEDERDSEGVLCKELGVEDDGLIDNVFAEQLVLSLDDDEDKVFPSPPADPILCSGAKIQNVPLESRINDSGQATPNSHMTPGVIGDVKYNISGVTSDSTGTDSRVWDTVEVHPLAMDTPPPKHPFQAGGCPLHPPPASTPLFPGLSDPDNRRERESPPLEICDLSPSLVALEVDSDEDSGTAHKSPFSDLSSDFQSGGDKMDAVESSPDLKCTHAKCASSASDPTALKMCDQGIRLRSYSYSSPKITLCASRNAQSSPTSTTSPEQRASGLLEQPHEKREVRFRRRAQSADDEGNMELAASLQHLTLSEFLKEIEEEDFDKYNIPSKAESDKYKVIRTFSFLKSRMSSTRNKSKGKGKDRDAKTWQLNAHCFATGSCVGNTVCLVCDKPASGKDLLHCSSCMVIIHKGCKESAPPCLKKLQDKYAVAMAKNKTASLPQNFTVRESPPHYVFPATMSLPLISPKERNDATALSNPPSGSFSYANDRQSESSETESDSWRNLSQSDQSELRQTATSSTSTESSIGEDCVDTYLQNDLAANAIEYEAESWSLSVEHKFCKKQDKRVVKRQDVIYELMQTEMHHLQTLHIMAEVFRRGMREEVQLDAEAVERVFPCLDQLLCFHHALFATMRERRYSSAHFQEPRNYLIQQIGDILLHQFSDENAERMKQIYGEFCSHHNEAVSFFKELQQHNKRFQNFIKQQSNNSLVRRREIPECILLVTQRITKYPVLLERVLQYTQNDTREHEDLLKALAQIREVITAVDLRVSEYERDQKLRDVWNRMENRSSAKLKNGHTFRKQDMMWLGQTLKHQGLLLWKTATGRLKDVLALLLTDTLIFLQEKDQKYTFATVDQKPPVISLQKLIVREVANEERGMFLISASAAGPEMYEVHASSKDERNTWMRLIRDAVESCPEEEEEYTSESEEERRAAEARMQKIHKLQESLMSQDQQICSSLEEKLQIYAELSALNWKMEASQLLVQPHSEDSPQAALLLATALQETENLKAMLSSRAGSPSSPSLDSLNDMFSGRPLTPRQTPTDCEALTREADVSEGEWPERNALQCFTHLQKGGLSDIDLKVAQSVQSLTQLLYSLQAAVTIQDSCYEVQRLLLSESKRPSPQSQQVHPASTRGHTLQEQEKQRNLEKQREEVAAAQRLQGRLRQERQRWERDCQVRQSLQGEQEIRLEERERQCHLETERLRQDREQLEEQLEEYQQSLERLREGQRSVEKEWQKLETQQKLFQSWRHSRQRSLPSMLPAIVIPLDGQQVTLPGQSYANDGSVFVNEAAFTNAAINNRHMHHKGNDPSAHNCLNTLLARSNHRQPPVLKSPEPHADLQKWALETSFFYTPPQRSDPHGHGQDREQPAVTGADQYQGLSHPCDPRPDCSVPVSLETESEEEDREENIVYL